LACGISRGCLHDASDSFQRLIDRPGADMDFIFIYMDDILVASRDETAHLQHLEKCKVGHQSVDFLGHRISAAFAETPLQHVAAIRDFSQPAEPMGLLSFLGPVNFSRRFIPGAARNLLPLTNTLGGGKRVKLGWS
jgi:hypothetical protein